MKLFFFAATLCLAADHRVAITIDDLPRGGDGGGRDYASIKAMTEILLAPFRQQHIPVTGFVNEAGLPAPELRRILDLWLDAGADLGNHTLTHADLSTMPLDQFERQVIDGEAVTKAALAARGRSEKYFRYPFLHTGPNPEVKKAFQTFLAEHGYINAPVTLDDSDYMYARAYTNPALRGRVLREYIPYMASIVEFFEARAVEVTGHDIPQILLIHASQLNADQMPALLAMFRAHGYAFVSLDEALMDPAYSLPEEYAGTGGFSWIHRWSMTRKMKGKGEPDEPSWVREEFIRAQKIR
jgi:peptidoglycan/xylan/chitin deacetylase (PgdA/CDA1 family)